MQIYVLAAIVLTAISTVQATTLPAEDWEDCTKAGTVCKTSGSTCVKHSDYYSQCTPAILPSGGLCGQNFGPNVWKYDGHCRTGETCQATGTDFHCKSVSTAPITTTIPPTGITYVLDWEDCSKLNTQCKTTSSSCIKISNNYSQCLPATLTSGSLCGQSGANNWKYDHCPTGETCKTSGSDSRCTK
ncbi:hypothetical protein PRIC1_006200 [Phytophthora ramorum]|uniref:CBM1 domain-containing protein n=1 Tax=Phytophthora ramorum TaxID=164328 RepID=H3GQK0_PHYRM|nr:hypothetical protein KRP23_14456 [Phytophthora ramorum]